MDSKRGGAVRAAGEAQEEWVKFGTNCKFCKKPISVMVSKEYRELGDPYQLLDMAACNNCADVRAWRRELEDKIGRLCNKVDRIWRILSEDSKAELRGKLIEATQSYARMISKTHFMDGMKWEEGIVDVLIAKPKEWPDVLTRMWKMFDQYVESQTK